ncbi:DNA mismatch repair protein MutS [uncultured Ruminococcus sp.]|uniref:DNA mismatch repair protein MutS n=1 Tax=uncultured Ruminococcus sp. TaxID=165186 RepID=UPI0025E6638B|nr:DNA mismatch repair protein MutS [uncultured Ruminococcus sp.]
MNLADVPKEKLSPGMRQYADLKEKYQDCILFFRLGDFYEMFFEDAILVSRELELTLTGKECGLEERAPMCGVPYHSVDLYLKRLIDRGYKIAICEQLTDPALSKGLVERDVIRIVTPGTLIDSTMLEDDSNNYICCLYYGNDGSCALCFADISTGEMSLAVPQETSDLTVRIIDLLSRYMPAELILNSQAMSLKSVMDFIRVRLQCTVTVREDTCFDLEQGRGTLCEQFGVSSLELLGISEDGADACAACGMLDYIHETQKRNISRFLSISVTDAEEAMGMGLNTRRNLELTETLRNKTRKGSLLWLLDSARTAMGKRMLKTWIEQPLIQPVKIMARLDAVEALTQNSVCLMEIRDLLDHVYDLERLMTRVMYQKATPRDLKALSMTAQQLPALKQELQKLADSRLLRSLEQQISPLERVSTLVENAIVDEPPLTLKDGGVIKDGFQEELDRQRRIMNGGAQIIEEIVQRERERTGIKGLKIGYNRVFGYYIEVTRSYFDLVPADYIRKQTLANSERYITEELKKVENEILGAKDRVLRLEEGIFNEVRDCIGAMLKSVQETAAAVAQVDVLASFANVALENAYTKPEISVDGSIQITAGRHPVVERMLTEEVFVPNDTYLDTKAQRLLVITGPNMSGKSTYMRQVALITLMAQIGSFVPAEYAKISVVDQIFTRIGASDDLTAGESTFMVEMKEVSDILCHATRNSLVILDEVGRGTSTFDGVSIARAVAEYISSRKIGCKTLFATHYHELLDLEQELDGVKNYSVAVKKHSDSIRFLRKIVPGGVDDSYGIAVAKLAGLPDQVVKRANQLLAEMEREAASDTPKKSVQSGQISFASMQKERVLSALQKTNLEELSDAECRELLADLTAMLS